VDIKNTGLQSSEFGKTINGNVTVLTVMAEVSCHTSIQLDITVLLFYFWFNGISTADIAALQLFWSWVE
jgi:hypothetical protein